MYPNILKIELCILNIYVCTGAKSSQKVLKNNIFLILKLKKKMFKIQNTLK